MSQKIFLYTIIMRVNKFHELHNFHICMCPSTGNDGGCNVNYKRENCCGGFNFAMFAVGYFPAKLKQPQSCKCETICNVFVMKFELRENKNHRN